MKPILTIITALALLLSISTAQEHHKPNALEQKLLEISSAALQDFDAQRVSIVVMHSTNGEVIAMVDTSFKNILEYSFEPGSTMNPITYALALENDKVKPDEIIDGHKGRYKILDKYITDEVGYKSLSTQDVIVHSSNIGIAQIGGRLDAIEFYSGLSKFGFGQVSMPEEQHEANGYIPNYQKLENEIYRATASYGYGVVVNMMQVLKAYSAFNNDGKMVMPTRYAPSNESAQVIQSQTANEVKKTLIKAVKEGTGRNADVYGLEVGGKTSVAHMVENRRYVERYNISFVGFANDAKNKYIIGVLIVDPKKEVTASQTSAPLFKKSVEAMVSEGYLTKDIGKYLRAFWKIKPDSNIQGVW